MAIVNIKGGQRKSATASGANALAVEFFALSPQTMDLIINKPNGATCAVTKVVGAAQEVILADTDNEVTTGASIGVRGVRLLAGDELRVAIDSTNGDKVVAGEAYADNY